MASEQQCADALHRLSERLTGGAATSPAQEFSRTLSCAVRDLGVVFGAHLEAGRLADIRIVSTPNAQIRLVMSSDDLLALVDGELALAPAWASGRIKIHAGVRDLLRLRAMF